ncbi:hypothetical protein ASG43_05225 [Aureimonas sp. Leaf454]|uniref:hypothetical protein n=1 Tax=Aureimonas sp. Leaf454 TaxID=1736381 RepID=UPI0006F6FD59|nr:hypothetical protein [Aureimonas sp. Leaf454]KQT50689.1 hypothetical protein ASG43_05225 [Aureimonas sp. Leaf454]
MMRCRIVYSIQPVHGVWTVEACGTHAGSYRTRRAALHVAAEEARRLQKMGHAVRIELLRPEGTQTLETRVLRHFH